ncbi:hypothetical protein PSRA_1009 [Pseudoscardovia radai]|uniref:Uncharacterized protein n=1 Tax=Pseudoscardovia radai TaxID=987066 RepID=A0A261EXM8_9BIFI|nr:hypothetical protein [Pseudoscardovia radai]OZG51612.1 hypothetical protein PSRA_1009 [Pseudoscardovia radai]
MTKMEHYGFVFKPNGNSVQGAKIPGAEVFGNDSVVTALARELGQNSLDAKLKDDDSPVTMVFELRTVPTTEIPDVENLRRHANSCARQYPDAPELQDAVDCLNSETIDVLRIGDYGTKGLTGSESLIEGRDSVLTALTRGSGLSVGKTDAGGSFGIGKAAGILASRARTELWVTKPYDSPETVFAGACQFTTHQKPGSNDPCDLLGAMGVYTSQDLPNDFQYLRNPRPFGGFPERTQSGTDTYILGYKRGADGEGFLDVRDAMIENFMVAISRGRLVVKGHGDGLSWRLDASNLEKQIGSMTDEATRGAMLAYYRAIQEEPVVKAIPRLGEVKLYINIDDCIRKRLDVLCVRKPLMKVHHFRLNSLSAAFAAVFECSSDEGNKRLRQMESARHDQWVATRGTPEQQKESKRILDDIRKFAREEINARTKHEMGDVLKIKGLNLLLPEDLQHADKTKVKGTNPATGDGDAREAATLQGKETEGKSTPVSAGKAVPISVIKPATAGSGNDQVTTGKRQHGINHRPPHPGPQPGFPAKGHPDNEGKSSLKSNSLSMRYWYEPATNSYVLVLRSVTGVAESGMLRLVASLDGQFDRNSVDVNVTSAEDITDDAGTRKALTVINNGIRDVTVSPQKPTRLRVHVDNRIRLQLGVAD